MYMGQDMIIKCIFCWLITDTIPAVIIIYIYQYKKLYSLTNSVRAV